MEEWKWLLLDHCHTENIANINVMVGNFSNDLKTTTKIWNYIWENQLNRIQLNTTIHLAIGCYLALCIIDLHANCPHFGNSNLIIFPRLFYFNTICICTRSPFYHVLYLRHSAGNKQCYSHSAKWKTNYESLPLWWICSSLCAAFNVHIALFQLWLTGEAYLAWTHWQHHWVLFWACVNKTFILSLLLCLSHSTQVCSCLLTS